MSIEKAKRYFEDMKCYVVDAFTDTVFQGDPAAVCVLEKWLPDALMQDIAMENNLSETAFTVRNGYARLSAYTCTSFCQNGGGYWLHRPVEAWMGRGLACVLEDE